MKKLSLTTLLILMGISLAHADVNISDAAGRAYFNCAPNGNMQIQVSGYSGSSQDNVTILNPQFCQTQATSLQFYRGKISQSAYLAVCNYQLNLETFYADASGSLQRYNVTTIGNDQSCLREAARINSETGNTNAGGTARASYNCTSDGHMEISLCSDNGGEGKAFAIIYNQGFCQQQANNLSYYLNTIRRRRQLAVCNYMLNLQTFEVDGGGQVRDLGVTVIGNAQRCLDEADRINRRPQFR